MPENDLATYLAEHAAYIYVRERVNDVWNSYSLAELPAQLRKQHVERFMRAGRIPYRLGTPRPFGAGGD